MRRGTWLSAIGVTLIVATACSHQSQPPSPAQSPPVSHEIPLGGAAKAGPSPTQAFASTSIPVGAAVVVRLQSPLSSADASSGEDFDAVLDEPVIVEGKTLMPKGTAVKGTVMTVARASAQPRNAGYLRLTLSSVAINGKLLAVHTSSVFTKGGRHDRDKAGLQRLAEQNPSPLLDPGTNLGSGNQRDAKFSTARRLTFRLVQPLPLNG